MVTLACYYKYILQNVEHRQEGWRNSYFLYLPDLQGNQALRNIISCIITPKNIACSIKKCKEEERKSQVFLLRRTLSMLQNYFQRAKKEYDPAVEANYVVSELIVKAGKPVTKG